MKDIQKAYCVGTAIPYVNERELHLLIQAGGNVIEDGYSFLDQVGPNSLMFIDHYGMIKITTVSSELGKAIMDEYRELKVSYPMTAVYEKGSIIEFTKENVYGIVDHVGFYDGIIYCQIAVRLNDDNNYVIEKDPDKLQFFMDYCIDVSKHGDAGKKILDILDKEKIKINTRYSDIIRGKHLKDYLIDGIKEGRKVCEEFNGDGILDTADRDGNIRFMVTMDFFSGELKDIERITGV